MATMMVYLLLLISGVTSGLSAGNAVLELAYGHPDAAAGSAVLMVMSGIVVLLQCVRLVIQALPEGVKDKEL